MDIKAFKAGKLKKAYKYSYFLPEKINHRFVWTGTINKYEENIRQVAHDKIFHVIELHVS